MSEENFIDNKIGWVIPVCKEDLYIISHLPQTCDENNRK